MRIAILMCNTDRSAFAARHPKDGEKWLALLAPLRPDWRFEVWDATEGTLPETLDGIDGAIVTGSPASVRSGEPWVAAVLETIREMHREDVRLFGACFGHQAIALALDGAVGDNDGPFVLGVVDAEMIEPAPWMAGAPLRFRIAAAHGEQVTRLPQGATLLARGPNSPLAGYALGDRVFTTAYHPEMTPAFVAALVEALASKLDPEVIAAARTSLDPPADRALFAGWIVRFFEHRA